MKQEDVNRRCVVFDRPIGEGNGIVGTVKEVYSSTHFRLRTDNGNDHEFIITDDKDKPKIKVQFLGDA